MSDQEFEDFCRATARIIEERGWRRGALADRIDPRGRNTGSVCLLGAMSLAYCNIAYGVLPTEILNRMENRIDPHCQAFRVTQFNDSRDSAEPVLRMLRNQNWEGTAHPSIKELRR